MAEAATKKLIKLNKFPGDDKVELDEAAYGASSIEGVIEAMEGSDNFYSISALDPATYAVAAPAEDKAKFAKFWKEVFPAQTGVSFCYMIQYDAKYNSDNYVKNGKVEAGPEATDAQLGNQFRPRYWNTQKKEYDADMNETLKSVIVNDNGIIQQLLGFDGSAAQIAALPKKFDFCYNTGYQRKGDVFVTEGGTDVCFGGENNGECIVFHKSKGGIFILNWATKGYSGDRPKVGSFNGVFSDFLTFCNTLCDKDGPVFIYSGEGMLKPSA